MRRGVVFFLILVFIFLAYWMLTMPTFSLRPLVCAVALSCLPLAAYAAKANSSANHKDEMQALKLQLQAMQANYEQRIASLEQKLNQAQSTAQRAEPQATAAVSAVATATPPTPANTVADANLKMPRPTNSNNATAFNPEISLILQGQYKTQKDIAERGITGFFPAGGHDHGTDSIPDANRRGFSVDHTELMLAANVDNMFRGQAIIAIKDGQAEVEEAWFKSLNLDHGLGLKAGRFRSGIGYLNEQHPHQWDFADAPLMYQALFGYEGSYVQDGIQGKWLAPTPFFLEFGAETGRGANYPGTNRNKNGSGAGAIFAHLGGDLGVEHSWRAGVSYLRTTAKDREAHMEDLNAVEALTQFSGKSSTWLADFVWKWAPNGNPKYQNLKLQGEYFQRKESGDLLCSDADAANPSACTGGVASGYQGKQSGWYAQAIYQFTPNWRVGLRSERLNSGTRDFGVNAVNLDVTGTGYKPKRDSIMLDYRWSEFSLMRLQYAQNKAMSGITDNQITLQYIMSLGAHGAHKF